MLQRVATELCCFKGEKLKQLGDDGTIERNSRPDDFLISSELFWNFFRGYFLFPREERKNSSDLSFDSSEVSFDSSEEIFLSSLGNGK